MNTPGLLSRVGGSALLFAVAAFVAGCSRMGDEHAGTPKSPANAVSTAVPDTELVSFPTADGGIVFANLTGSGTRGVVLAHGGRWTKESWKPQARQLVREGYMVLAIDFRGRGRSHGPAADSAGEGVRFDVLAAVRYLHERGATAVSVVGSSFGGTAAAEASVDAREGEIDALILIAHGAIDAPEKMKGRKLFILARNDFQGDDRRPRLPSIREQFERADFPKELVLLEGSAHAQAMFDTDQGPRLMAEIKRFLAATNN